MDDWRLDTLSSRLSALYYFQDLGLANNMTQRPIVLTGGGKRIGLALAQHFVAHQQPLIISYRTHYPAIDQLKQAGVICLAADFSTDQGILDFAAEVRAIAPSLRAVIHNASDWQAENAEVPLASTLDAMKERVVQSPDVIPADSDAAKVALAQGGEAAKRVEIPGVASSEMPSSDVGRFFETQTTKGGRYTVTLPDGTKIEEVNKVTAAQMVPFDSVKFTGNYGNTTEVSYQVAKRAAKKGAKYYHITREWQENGGNVTVSADLYK